MLNYEERLGDSAEWHRTALPLLRGRRENRVRFFQHKGPPVSHMEFLASWKVGIPGKIQMIRHIPMAGSGSSVQVFSVFLSLIFSRLAFRLLLWTGRACDEALYTPRLLVLFLVVCFSPALAYLRLHLF